MITNNEGFTVGDLTIVISILLIVFFLWSGVSKKQQSRKGSISLDGLELISRSALNAKD